MRPNAFIASSIAGFAVCLTGDVQLDERKVLACDIVRALRLCRDCWPVATTRSPTFNVALAVAAPMPLPAPVMNQTLLI